MSETIPQFFQVVDSYRTATGLSEARVSTLVFNGGSRLRQIREGRDVGVRILARAIQWFSDHWPDDAAWPDGIDRPAPSIAEAAE